MAVVSPCQLSPSQRLSPASRAQRVLCGPHACSNYTACLCYLVITPGVLELYGLPYDVGAVPRPVRKSVLSSGDRRPRRQSPPEAWAVRRGGNALNAPEHPKARITNDAPPPRLVAQA